MEDKLRISKGKIILNTHLFQWTEDDFLIMYVPSLKLSAYGKTKTEAFDMLKEVYQDFCENLLKLSNPAIAAHLKSIGWSQEHLKNKNFSKTYIDKKGVIQDLDMSMADIDITEERIELPVL